ncbi:MAG: hypothetical protein HQL96_10700 [Magnetococcales bacterium]|nr:hypothetical protein [Magnetococcales bacterium]
MRQDETDTTSIRNAKPPMATKLLLVARIALLIGVAAALVLYLLLGHWAGEEGMTYQEILSGYLMTRRHLLPVLLLLGLSLIALTGLITWLIASYSIWRVRGPMFWIDLHLGRQVRHGLPTLVLGLEGEPVPLENVQYAVATTRLRDHYEALRASSRQALDQLGRTDPEARRELQNALHRLRELDRHVQF